MQTFCAVYNFKSLIKQPTCYKNPVKPSCIDLMLTNIPRMFQSTCVIETGLSDFDLMIVTVLRKTFSHLSTFLMKRLEFLLKTICLMRFMLIMITGWKGSAKQL